MCICFQYHKPVCGSYFWYIVLELGVWKSIRLYNDYDTLCYDTHNRLHVYPFFHALPHWQRRRLFSHRQNFISSGDINLHPENVARTKKCVIFVSKTENELANFDLFCG